MYPFIILIDEHVPLNIGAGRIFFREGPIVEFPGVDQKYFVGMAKSGKITFSPLETKKTTFFAKIDGKMSNFKISVRPWPPLSKPMPLKLLMIQRLRKITKINLPMSMLWLLKTIYNYFYFYLWTRHEVHRAQARTICTTQIDNNRHRTFCMALVVGP